MNPNAGGFDLNQQYAYSHNEGYNAQQQPSMPGAEYGMYQGGYGDQSVGGYAGEMNYAEQAGYAGAGGYYPAQEYVGGAGLQQDAAFHEWGQSQEFAQTAEPGCYYSVMPIKPQIYGAPVTAIAYDEGYAAMYVASATQAMSTGRRFNHRASIHVTHSTTDGSLYASVGGHPEAPARVLNTLYEEIYGPVTAAPSAGRRHIPSHAYKPKFGTTDPALPNVAPRTYQMGTTTLLPATKGYVASVSPSGVRLHTHGGLQIADYFVEGMVSGTRHPGHEDVLTHLTVGGCGIGEMSNGHVNRQQVTVLDVWQGLRSVASYSLDRRKNDTSVAVTALATSYSKGSVIAGCSDGQMRLLDDRVRELAKLKSHFGGVVDVAVSDDGTLLATTGYGSRPTRSSGSPLYSFPDPTIFVYDIRYLGRGGIPHPFAGVRGGPRHVAFLPDINDQPSNRLLVASGQVGGGLQVIVPFLEPSHNAADFIQPPLEQGESMSALTLYEDNLAIGTSAGNVLQYRLAGYEAKPVASRTKQGIFIPSRDVASSAKAPSGAFGKGGNEQPKVKEPLVMPPFEATVPPLSLEAAILQTADPNTRIGMNERIKSVSSAYILCRDPKVSSIGDSSNATSTSFGELAASTMIAPGRLHVSSNLLSKASHSVDFLQTVATADLELDVFADHRPDWIKKKIRKKIDPKDNPNKLLYTGKLFGVPYEPSLNRSKQPSRRTRSRGSSGDENASIDVPHRYRLTFRPTHKTGSSFNRADYNKTGYLPGWDYPPTMPNAFVPGVLLLLYSIPEIRSAMLKAQLDDRFLSASKESDRSLVPELGFLFHRIESLSRAARIFADVPTAISRIEPWAPSNFISALATLPEAEQLQILDGSPAAVDSPRRPEAFYRFILYQIDKELSKDSSAKLVDTLGGVDFTSVNEFISGSSPPSKSCTRALTVDLSYDAFVNKSEESQRSPCFSEVLQYTLCREARLRAWSQSSKSYETIVQRKIATCLPKLLSLSCACAGRKEEEGLQLWRSETGDRGHWLPEVIEIELEDRGNVVVRELQRDIENGSEQWKECKGSTPLPSSVSEIVSNSNLASDGPRTRQYRLDAVLSVVRDDMDRNCPEEMVLINEDEESFGHHVLHARVTKRQKRRLLEKQRDALEELLSVTESADSNELTLVGANRDRELLMKRLDDAKQHLDKMSQDSSEDDWVLCNGLVMSKTVVEDATAFHVKFKEPCLVVYRAVEDKEEDTSENESLRGGGYVPPSIIKTQSITDGFRSPYSVNQNVVALPGKSLIAFDAEFVSIQEEESAHTDAGSKVTIREMRYAVARISVIDCKLRHVVIDDHVLPREPIVDYLTRFSGIVEKDLDPKQSPHHLITTRLAYLKLRCLMERGCIFVGHGLRQDFWTMNLHVPANQIIDTVEIYHKPAQRYISLRFLTNFVLKRDMQQDIHDSLEDAMAAYELFMKAVELKKNGEFDELLDDLYEYGQKTDWKLGIDD